jgi:hypothetical protein
MKVSACYFNPADRREALGRYATADGFTAVVEPPRAQCPSCREVLPEPRKTEMVLDARDVPWGLVIAIQDVTKAAGVNVIHYLVQQKN